MAPSSAPELQDVFNPVASRTGQNETTDAQPALPADFANDSYIPRPLLTKAPVATNPVLILAPDSGVPEGRHTAILSLYIDEDGFVQRIHVDASTRYPELDAAARSAFLAARFRPGEIGDRRVRARLRVEVVFVQIPD